MIHLHILASIIIIIGVVIDIIWPHYFGIIHGGIGVRRGILDNFGKQAFLLSSYGLHHMGRDIWTASLGICERWLAPVIARAAWLRPGDIFLMSIVCICCEAAASLFNNQIPNRH